MPHIVLEYSSNLGDDLRVAPLLGKLHRALGDMEEFETDRIKSRTIELDTYIVGRGDERGFIHATVAFSPGRPELARKGLGERLLGILAGETASARIEVSRSVEIRQFEEGMYFKDDDRARSDH